MSLESVWSSCNGSAKAPGPVDPLRDEANFEKAPNVDQIFGSRYGFVLE